MNTSKIKHYITQSILFTESECNEILKYCTDLTDHSWSVTLDGKYTESGCSLKHQSMNDFYSNDTKWFYDRIMEWASSTLGIVWKNPPYSSFRKYDIGDYFIKHTDNVAKDGAPKRYFTMSIQLTDGKLYKGGDIIANDNFKFQKEIGNVLLWGANIPHEVTQLKSGERSSLIFFTSSHHLDFKRKLL
tara:strand:+ start:1359 stop:1922 length:564 start_codon:yes stop_codon:yes gene_type:complete